MPKNSTPIVIMLYDPETNEIKQEINQCFIPWGILKSVVRLTKEIDLDDLANIKEEDIDSIANLVVEIFGKRFTVEDLNLYSDLGDMVSVLRSILSKARGISTNPTPPAD